MKSYKIHKYTAKRLQNDENYKEQVYKELSTTLVDIPEKVSKMTFHWHGRTVPISNCAGILSVICDVIDRELYDLTISSRPSNYTYNYLEIE